MSFLNLFERDFDGYFFRGFIAPAFSLTSFCVLFRSKFKYIWVCCHRFLIFERYNEIGLKHVLSVNSLLLYKCSFNVIFVFL